MRSWLPTSAKRKNYRARAALNTQHYANDVKKFSVAGNNWYLMALYVEGSANTPPPAFTFSLSNDGVTFGPEEALFAGASASDVFDDTFICDPGRRCSGGSVRCQSPRPRTSQMTWKDVCRELDINASPAMLT